MRALRFNIASFVGAALLGLLATNVVAAVPAKKPAATPIKAKTAVVATPLSCKQSFSPERVAAGEDCTPISGDLCPFINTGNPVLPVKGVRPCDGVTITRHPITAAGFTTEYLAIRPSTGKPESVYLQVHFLGTNIDVHSNQIRLAELAKARNVLILVPQAPSALPSLPLPKTIGLQTLGLPLPPELNQPPIVTRDIYDPLVPILVALGLSAPRWPNNALEPIDDYVALLDAVVAEGRQKFNAAGVPLYVGGLSNGAVMAYLYSCARADKVAAVEPVAANLNQDMLNACPALATVIVHGTADPLVPYIGLGISAGAEQTYARFKSANGCGGPDQTATIPGALVGDPFPVTFRYTQTCSNGRRVYLVTVNGGGHTWPDADDSTLGLSLNIFGPISRNWDATIYGYDLMKAAAGK